MLSKLKSLKWRGNNSSADATVSNTDSSGKPASSRNQSGSKTDATLARASEDVLAALKDPSEKKRLAAISKIDDLALLLSTALQDQSDAVRNSAAKQYARHLTDEGTTKTLVSTYFTDATKKNLAIAITAHNRSAEIRNHGSSLFVEDTDLCDIALATRFHDTRQSVAQRISSLESIDRCWRGLKSKDKAVAKILKGQLDVARDAELLKQQQSQTTRKIIDEMERLATGAWSPNYTTRFELFDQQWQQLTFRPTTADAAQYQSLRQIAADKVATNQERQKKHDDCVAITDQIVQLHDDLLAASATTLVELYEPSRRSFDTCKARWRQTDKDFSSFKDIEQDYKQATQSAKKQLQQVAVIVNAISALHPKPKDRCTEKANLTNNDSAAAGTTDREAVTLSAANSNTKNSVSDYSGNEKPSGNNLGSNSGGPPPPLTHRPTATNLADTISTLSALNDACKQADEKAGYASELPQLLAQLKKGAADQQERQEALQNSIGRQFSSLNSALASKRWGSGALNLSAIVEQIDKLPENDKPRYQEKLSRLENKLNELGDWKQFATEPKLISLCEQMEKIPDLGLTPRDQADRIKALQQQWKSMGASPALEENWPRFKVAADRAYEPCAKFFATKRQEKNSKLKYRSDVCEMLESYLEKSDWQNPEWKLVEKTLRAAKKEWHDTRVFDRKASAELDQRFTRIVEAINEKLSPAYDAGAQDKTDLIEKVKALSEGEINQHCMNQVKRLQGLWRRTGITRQKDDKELWAQFNELCSDIYSRHRDLQKKQYAASIQHVTRGKEIIRELKQLAKIDTGIDEKALQQLQDEFQSLPEFPERDGKYLMRDFARVIDSVETQIHKLGEHSRTAEIARITENATICAMLEKLIGQPSALALTESDRLLTQWDNGEKGDNAKWKKAISQRRDSSLKHLKANTLPDYEENNLKRRLLCIEAEIMKDKATPESDRELRMQHQLDKLQTGDRRNINHSTNEETIHLQMAWLAAAPADPAKADALEQRFNSALDN